MKLTNTHIHLVLVGNLSLHSVNYVCWKKLNSIINLSTYIIFNLYIGLEKVLGSSRDPSPPLPFWDKIRLIYHGRLTMMVNELKVKLHASLDPYNTTEEMELNWYNTAMDWTNGKFNF